MSDNTASFSVGPGDSRCKYWAKQVPLSALPMPASIDGANSLPGGYLRNGNTELFDGEILIEGEANHHSKQRGWSYWLVRVNPTEGKDGEYIRTKMSSEINARVKACIKEAAKRGLLSKEHLRGSGDIAAAVRFGHLLSAYPGKLLKDIELELGLIAEQ